MHPLPSAKTQARLLRQHLSKLGFTVPHQDCLEAVALVMGFKDWKTYCAADGPSKIMPLSAPTAPVASTSAPNDAWAKAARNVDESAGALYTVPVTVDVTMTAQVLVRASDTQSAAEHARRLAKENYPAGFELDEGNYHGLADFYVSDADAVTCEGSPEPKGPPVLSQDDLSIVSASYHLGSRELGGSLTVFTKDRKYQVKAKLSANGATLADGPNAHRGTLLIRLEPYGNFMAVADHWPVLAEYVNEDYAYHAALPGAHLHELLLDGKLLDFLKR